MIGGMRSTYSTLEVARRLGVSIQSVQRWVDVGRLRAWRTPGGHRRIEAADAEALFREFAAGGAVPATAPPAVAAAPSVLVVDDDAVHLELAVELVQLSLPLAAVVGAANGFEALLSAGKQRFDLVLADVAMPKMNGLEMLRHLVQGAHGPRFVLVTSSRSMAELRALGSLPEGASFMPKPLNPELLGAWLRDRFPNAPATESRRSTLSALLSADQAEVKSKPNERRKSS